MINLTPQLFLSINTIAYDIHRRSIYTRDIDTSGLLDFWIDIPEKRKDCEDYARAYILILREKLGLDPYSLGRVICYIDPSDHESGHAVCIVNTDKGAYVLDNIVPNMRPWKDVPYKWIYDSFPPYLLKQINQE